MEDSKTKYLDARNRANRNYYAKNKEKVKMMKYFSYARTYINNSNDIEKLQELKLLLDNKLKELG